MADRGLRSGTTRVVAGNVYDKYNTKNPVERLMVRNFLSGLLSFVAGLDAATVLEVGCGEGNISDAVGRVVTPGRIFSCDISQEILAEAKARYPSLKIFTASAYDLPFVSGSFDLVIASEVLEHLDEPERAVEEIDRVATRSVLVSVPREPVWSVLNMMRGKYVTEWGNTPGHLKRWSKRGIVRLLERKFDVVDVMTPLPWTICLCNKRRTG